MCGKLLFVSLHIDDYVMVTMVLLAHPKQEMVCKLYHPRLALGAKVTQRHVAETQFSPCFPFALVAGR